MPQRTNRNGPFKSKPEWPHRNDAKTKHKGSHGRWCVLSVVLFRGFGRPRNSQNMHVHAGATRSLNGGNFASSAYITRDVSMRSKAEWLCNVRQIDDYSAG